LIVKILKDAFDAGKKFRVIVVDSRPKSEGRNASDWNNHLATTC
jgi:translation initiation factor 2B subunit (eIF-2B alpha/beta/delta family)